MDLFHDALALPGHLGRGLHGGHVRTDSAATDATTTTTASQTTGLMSPIRRLLWPSKALCDPARQQLPETPPNPVADADRPENKAYRIPILRVKLDQAQHYTEWLAAATELDALEGHDDWKLEEECAEYDVELVKTRLREMDNIRIERDQKKMMMLVRTGLTRNLGGMGSLRLYKHSRVGTKALIERYIESVLDTIDALVNITKNGAGPLEPGMVLQELLLARQAFGRSALMLSGGGTFGMNHIGVVKCLFQANLLPRIISGASAGSIVAAVLCTKNDDEIPAFLKDFCYGNLEVFEKAGQETGLVSKAFRFLTKGSLFDIDNLVRVMHDLVGDMTFQEAYNRTRRILNICVSAASVYELPKLLNYVTAPNVMIWSAVAASCSVPFVFSPGRLLAKDPRTGEHVPWNQQAQQWIDGSVENDIPMQRLAEMFNVNHFIVSQVNPHVVPFLEKDEKDIAKEARYAQESRTDGTNLAHKMTTMARDEAMHRLHVLQEFGILPNVMSKIRSVVGQRYAGDITIFPKISYANFPYVLSNPDTAFLLDATLSGERATWPKLSEIRNHCAIELSIDDAVHQLMTCVAFGPCQLDNHSLATIGYPLTQSARRFRQNATTSKRPHHYRALRTSLDLPRVGLREHIRTPALVTTTPGDIRFQVGPTKKKHAAAADLASFSGSDTDDEMDSSDDNDGNWRLSADDDDDEEEETTDSSSQRSPTLPNQNSLWPSALLFPWASQPATPSFGNHGSKPFGMAPLSKVEGAGGGGGNKVDKSMADVPRQISGAQTGPESTYKRLFHGNGGIRDGVTAQSGPNKNENNSNNNNNNNTHNNKGLRRRSRSVVDLDISGTRGMMRRRKYSLSSTGGKRD